MKIFSRLITAVATAVVVLLPLLAVGPVRAGNPVLVFGTPWGEADTAVEIIVRADGLLLRDTAFRWIAVGRADLADFDARLHRAGAWITLDASWVFGCSNSNRT